MMSFASELALDVYSNEAFRADYSRLQRDNLLLDIAVTEDNAEGRTIDGSALQRLLQSALIFAISETDYLRNIAQRISTAAMRLTPDDEIVRELFALIQSRLENFPTLQAALGSMAAPEFAPLSLQLEYVRSRHDHTIIAGLDEYVFTPFQLESWKVLASKRPATLTGPTSAGKSFVLLHQIVEKFRTKSANTVVYIVPTRALINQVSEDMQIALSARQVTDVSITSVPVDLTEVGLSKYFYVLTQERLESLLISSPDFPIDMIVIDEAQILADNSRGVLLESVLDRISVRERVNPQFIFSGPMLNNPRYFADLFKLDNFATCTTNQSPVTQNIIYLDYLAAPANTVSVSVGPPDARENIAAVHVEARLGTELDKLSYLSFLFGKSGSSIVYANGKADSETIATKIALELPPDDMVSRDLAELISFVKKHVHKDYALVGTLEKGVGFHYGHMPALLRKELEEHFKARRISFLVCTSTLLYGLNLPARNIFLSKPTTGRDQPISGPDFWNLAGRAGRLGKELEGNVYVIDYDNWESKPLGESKEVVVESALKATLVDKTADLAAFLDAPDTSSEKAPELEITLGKLVLDERKGHLSRTLERYSHAGNVAALSEIGARIGAISRTIELPDTILDKNIGVSVFRQRDLYRYMLKRIGELSPEELLPAYPLIEFEEARKNYLRAFKRIHTYLLKYPGKDRRQYFFAPLALRWMRGDPLPVLIDSALKYNRDQKQGRSTARVIRDTMESVEDDLRFRYVKFFTCYNSVLEYALRQTGHDGYVKAIPNVPIFLEMGGSSGAMINLMALGLSRTSAVALSEYVTDKEMSLQQMSRWLMQIQPEQFDISPACQREIIQVKAALQV